MSIYADIWDAMEPEKAGLPKYADMPPEMRADFDAKCRGEDEFHARVARLTLSGMTYDEAYQKARRGQ
jgi:hypothetical protein